MAALGPSGSDLPTFRDCHPPVGRRQLPAEEVDHRPAPRSVAGRRSAGPIVLGAARDLPDPVEVAAGFHRVRPAHGNRTRPSGLARGYLVPRLWAGGAMPPGRHGVGPRERVVPVFSHDGDRVGNVGLRTLQHADRAAVRARDMPVHQRLDRVLHGKVEERLTVRTDRGVLHRGPEVPARFLGDGQGTERPVPNPTAEPRGREGRRSRAGRPPDARRAILIAGRAADRVR